MIDLHSHILPGLDDGPRTMAGAVQMAEAAVAARTRTILATPHVNLVYDVSPEEIELAVAELNAELGRRDIGLECWRRRGSALEACRPGRRDARMLGSGSHGRQDAPRLVEQAMNNPLLLSWQHALPAGVRPDRRCKA